LTKSTLYNKSIRRHEVKDKTVLVRVDYNLPMEPGTTNILDDTRIIASIPQIEYLLEKNCKVVLLSHLGRPQDKPDSQFSMEPISNRLSQIIKMPVMQLPGCRGEQILKKISAMQHRSIAMLENIRFEIGESKNEYKLSRELAKLADIFINDAFGVAHRAHASTEGITRHIPSFIGFLMEKELGMLGALMDNPSRPMTSIIGGAKASDKMSLLQNLSKKVDSIIIGGGMAATFLKAKGFNVGASAFEQDRVLEALDLMAHKPNTMAKVIIPCDVIVAENFAYDANFQTVSVDSVPENWIIVDIGPVTSTNYGSIIAESSTVIWNGPMGVFEWDNFSSGTIKVANALSKLNDGITVVGGGSTAQVMSKLDLVNTVTHVSTGGGATLTYMEGKPLPAIEAILEQ